MMKPKITRTTFDKVGSEPLPVTGIYILAYLGKIIYVGKASVSVEERLLSHYYNAEKDYELLGKWLHINADHVNVRLDVLETPPEAPSSWLREAEAACIRRFGPLLNTHLNH